MIDQRAEADAAADTKINQKVNRAYREAFEAKFPDQCQHIMRLMAERLQQGLRKDANGITNLEAAALALGLAAIHSIHANMIHYTAYVYKWTHIPTLKWYVGSRVSKRAHLDDGYICSSYIVKPMVKNNSSDWQRTIIATGSAEDMLLLEETILTTVDARNDNRSYNLHNSDHKFNNAGRSWNGKRAGKNNPMYGRKVSEEVKSLLREQRTGKPRPDLVGKKRPCHAELMRKMMTGRKLSDETKKKISLARLNRYA